MRRFLIPLILLPTLALTSCTTDAVSDDDAGTAPAGPAGAQGLDVGDTALVGCDEGDDPATCPVSFVVTDLSRGATCADVGLDTDALSPPAAEGEYVRVTSRVTAAGELPEPVDTMWLTGQWHVVGADGVTAQVDSTLMACAGADFGFGWTGEFVPGATTETTYVFDIAPGATDLVLIDPATDSRWAWAIP